MEREEVKAIITESYNKLSFNETALLLKAVNEGWFAGSKLSVNEFIEYTVDCYIGICDTAEQLRNQVEKDAKNIIAEIKG